MTQRCACCDKPFDPRPQVPDQAFCSAPDCQRARKRQWQRAKLPSDPDYRINQRADRVALARLCPETAPTLGNTDEKTNREWLVC